MSPGRCVLAFTVIGVFSTALRISPLGRLRQPFIHPATPRQPNGPPTRTTAPTSALSRRDFPALNRPNPPDLIYFDNAATTQKPTPVIEAITAYYSTPCANVHRSQHSLAASASSRYESARQNLARFLRASSSSEIVFTSGATESINLVANSWCIDNVGPRDVIVLPLSEHNSNIIPWQLHAERSGCRVSFLQLTPDGSIDLDDYKRHLSLARVKLVSLAHASNVLGRVQDLAPLIRLAHEHGAKVNVTELDCDFLVGSAHKMYGPTGIGFLYAKRSVLESMRPWKGGGGTVKSVDTFGFESEDIPQRFESGTPPVAQALGFSAAVDFLRATGLQKASHIKV